MNHDIENIIMQDLQRSSIRYENEVRVIQKLTNIQITNDNMFCKKYTKSLCLDTQKKTYIIKMLHLLVKMMNIY